MHAPARLTSDAAVRAALLSVALRGIGLVVGVGALALWPVASHPAPFARDGAAWLTLALLVGYGVRTRVLATLDGKPPQRSLDHAWTRAWQADRDDAILGAVVAGWVPAALLTGVVLVLTPHVTDPDPAHASAWLLLATPSFVTAWAFAATAWLDACRTALAGLDPRDLRRA